MKNVIIFLSILILLFTPVMVSAQSTAFGVDGSAWPTINLVSFPVPAGAPITVIGGTTSGVGGDFGPGGVFYSTEAQNLLTYNLTTGAPTIAGTITGVNADHMPINGLAYDHSTGTMYAIAHKISPSDSELYTLDLTTAIATLVGTISNSNFIIALAVNCVGELFGIDQENGNLIRINPITAEGEIIGPLNFAPGMFAQDADFDPSDGTLYWTAYNGTSGELRTIDVNTGNSTQQNIWSADIYVFGIQGDCVTTSVGQSQDEIPTNFELFQNYPNPFNPVTTIQYQMPNRSEVKLLIFSLLGQHVITLVDEVQSMGIHSVQWNGKDDTGTDVANGVYLSLLQTKEFVQVRKLALLR